MQVQASHGLESIGLVCRVGFKLGAFPFKWRSKTNTVSRTMSKLHLIRWALVLCYTVFNTIFMAIRLVQATCCMHISYGKLLLNLFSVVTYSTAAGLQLNTIVFLDEMPVFFNRLRRTNDYFQNADKWKFEEKPEKVKDTSGRTLRIITFLIYSYSFFQMFIAIRGTSNPKYVYSLIDLKGVPKWKLIPLGIFESYMSAAAASVLLFYLLIYLFYVKCTSDHIETINGVSPLKVPMYYRIMQLMNMQFNQLYRHLPLLFTTGTVMLVWIISSYATLRMYHEIQLPAFLGFPMAIVACSMIILEAFPISYRIDEDSQSTISTVLATSTRRELIYKYMKSCKYLEVCVSNFYSIKRSTTFTFFETAISYTVTLLLTY